MFFYTFSVQTIDLMCQLRLSFCIDTDKCCGLWAAIRPQKFALSSWVAREDGGCTTNKSWPANHNYHKVPSETYRDSGCKSLRSLDVLSRWQFSTFS